MGLLLLLAKEAIDLFKNDDLRNGLKQTINTGLNKINELFDSDQDGEIEPEEWENLKIYIQMIVSIYGQAAISSGDISELEEEGIDHVFENVIFGGDKPVVSQEILKKMNIKKKNYKNELYEIFMNPKSLEAIAEYAIDKEIEDIFYICACEMVFCDEIIDENERKFLDNFSSFLGLPVLDKKRIEKENLIKKEKQ